jgi:ribosomal subunit interface protein
VGLAVGGQNSGKIYRTEVNLSLPGELLRVEKTEKDIFKSIDKVKDHLRLSIQKYKDKKIASRRPK